MPKKTDNKAPKGSSKPASPKKSGEKKKAAASEPPSLTGFPKYEKFLRKVMKKAEMDEEAFDRKLSVCDLCSCKGMCCHDGAHVAEGEIEVLFAITDEHEDRLREYGVDVDGGLFERDEDHEWKTQTRRRPFRKTVEKFPRHFTSTCCVFLLEDGRCGLQALSMDLGHHKWYYKPVTCWLHPITLGYESTPGVYLIDEDTDPSTAKGYPGFTAWTHCGRTDPDGKSARKVLKEELKFLGKIVGKKFV